MPFSIASTLTTLSEQEQLAVTANINFLNTLAHRRGYRGFLVRDDSRLAYLWASYNTNDAIPEDIVDEMAVTQFLHAETSYGRDIEGDMRRIANAMKKRYSRLSWSEVWLIVKYYAPDALRMSHTARYGGIPQLATQDAAELEDPPPLPAFGPC